MHGQAVRRVVRIAVEKPDQVAARELVCAGASERVTEEKACRSALGRLRERLEAWRFDEVDEIADRFVAAPGDELVLGRGELVPEALCRKRGRRCEPALVEGFLVREHRGALRVGGRRSRGGGGLRGGNGRSARARWRRFVGFRSVVARFFRGGSLRVSDRSEGDEEHGVRDEANDAHQSITVARSLTESSYSPSWSSGKSSAMSESSSTVKLVSTRLLSGTTMANFDVWNERYSRLRAS